MEKSVWVIRAGEKARYIDDFKKHGIVAVGFKELGNLAKISSPEELNKKAQEVYPTATKAELRAIVSQVSKFLFDLQKGEIVISYNPSTREYLIGTVQGNCEYTPNLIDRLPTTRKVSWEHKIPRDSLSVQTKNSLGAIQTLFKPSDEAVSEILLIISGGSTPTPKESTAAEAEVIRKDVVERAHEFIKDKINSLDWEDMQELVAGILRSMGYKTRISPPGPDRAVDIMASPDGLGLSQPRIFVEVKHRPKEQIGSKDIRNFIGGRNPQQDKCLFISTGGFTKDAKYEADRSTVPLTLLDLDDLTELLIQNYENIDTETKSLIPLIKVYWPAKIE